MTRVCRNSILSLSILTLLSTFLFSTVEAEEKRSTFSIMEAREKGFFNIGPAVGDVTSSFDETLKKDVIKFDYSIFSGAIIGVWTKSFPTELEAGASDAVRIGVMVPKPEQLGQVSVKVEIKGTRNMQTIHVPLKTGWNSVREAIDWNTIGQMREVVFVVSPMKIVPAAGNPMWFNPGEANPSEAGKQLEGILYFDLDFYRMTALQKYFTFAKFGLVLALGLLIALLFGIIWPVPKRNGDEFKPDLGIRRDILYGLTAVLIGATALRIYLIGKASLLTKGINFEFLIIAAFGLAIAWLFKKALTGKDLSPAEAFLNVVLAGFLAAASSRQELLQSPSTWAQMLMLNGSIASIAFLIYHITNAQALASGGKHLRPITSLMIAGTPFLFNWLLLLENTVILQTLGNIFSAGFLAAWPDASQLLGRIIVVFVFNEAVTNAIGIQTKKKALTSLAGHLFTLLISIGVVISPAIADLGSTKFVATLPVILKAIASMLASMFSFAGLWGEVYLITGMILDGLQHKAPSQETVSKNINTGMKKGMVYTAIFMALIYALKMLLDLQLTQKVMSGLPYVIGVLAGALVFPLLKTLVETFDGSQPFFERMRFSYRDLTLLARGAIVGLAGAHMIKTNMFQQGMSERILFGFVVGLLASGGVSLTRDAFYAVRGWGKIQSWRLYLIDSFLGAFIGSAGAFYLDALQVPVVIEKFKLYTSSGFQAVDYITYPLINKWGRIDLGSYTGGAKLLFIESLAGVINWSIAAWLFAINKVFMEAYFQKDKAPIKFFFSRAGFVELIRHMLYVLRWGLWMSPIIFTFLRMMPDPTWYNQDGAIRTVFAIYNNITMSPNQFQAWSLNLFVLVLASDIFRVLIWMDHMGLRVATLVNLSFIGLDKLDERIARFIGPAAAQRYIPEAVKRFATWAPLLIPFYLPRGSAWDYAWNTAEAMRNSSQGKGIIPAIQSLTPVQALGIGIVAIIICAVLSSIFRSRHRRNALRLEKTYELGNREYKVVVRENGEAYSEALTREYDVSRRSYDIIDPCGRILYILDPSQPNGASSRYWPVLGNFPKERFASSSISRDNNTLKIVNTSNGVRASIDISLPDEDTASEIWTVKIDNLTDKPRHLKVVPYLEWVLNGGIHDRFHTQYARLYPEMEYVREANAVLAWHKGTKAMGILACDKVPEGFLISRVDFIGRAGTIWSPRILDTMNFLEARDTSACPTFDPIGSLVVDIMANPKSSGTIRFMVGLSKNKEGAIGMINKHLKPQGPAANPVLAPKVRSPLIGHGEIPAGTPSPYYEYADNGRKLIVRTPFTPRPYDHALSNAIHSIMVTNRGIHTSCNGNSQQNRLTPDWPDTVTKEIPVEAIYMYDPAENDWYSPTYHPLNDTRAKNESEFSIDGMALFRMSRGDISTELTIFVPPDDPTGVYILTVRNSAQKPKKLRLAPYFQIAMAFQPEKSGTLTEYHDKASGALLFENPRNIFRSGWAFASMSVPAQRSETKRGRFFGKGRGVVHPFMVEKGQPDIDQFTDDRQIASFLTTLEIPANGEKTVVLTLGQADTRKEGLRLVRKYKDAAAARKALDETKQWWTNFMSTVSVETNQPEFDRFQNWLKYQALAERIWARRGFYQTSGAYGFRDQLQDTVNLIWVDPALARKQIILHAAHQFIEGDVFHWFFTLTDGRTAFSCRSHASDNPVWLAWGVVEYINATGDYSILDEMTSYVISEFPFAPLPKNKQGWGHLYHRSTRSDTVYRHCMRSIDLVLKKRMGKHGLPLMGTGDWNDGLDEIGSEGRGESVWLGFFLYYILKDMVDIIQRKEGKKRKDYYARRMKDLAAALEKTWRGDRYLRAIHDDGTEIGVKGSGIWEIDALTAAWAVTSGINPDRGLTIFNTALSVLEKEDTILLGWPALHEDTKPYLGRSSKYPEGVRENGMYCHGVQWLIKAARILAEGFEKRGEGVRAAEYRSIAYRLWLKISPLTHVVPQKIEIYGGQPNKQAADMLTKFDPGRMIWHGYTGAAGWMLRQAIEGVVGASLIRNELILPNDLDKPRGSLKIKSVRISQRTGQAKTDELKHSQECKVIEGGTYIYHKNV